VFPSLATDRPVGGTCNRYAEKMRRRAASARSEGGGSTAGATEHGGISRSRAGVFCHPIPQSEHKSLYNRDRSQRWGSGKRAASLQSAMQVASGGAIRHRAEASQNGCSASQ
jgi:hypothetical protein